MSKNIESLIQNLKCPFINSIILSNGSIFVLESIMGEYKSIRVLCKSTLTSFFDHNNEDYLIDFDFLNNHENENFSVSVGEGSFGGDGIIYLKNKITGKLEWFIFLENSNPFDNVTIENNCVLAHSTKDFTLRVPIFTPENITVE